MFKRVIWFAAGAAVGVAGVKRVERVVQERLEQYSPPAVASSFGNAARDLSLEVKDAVRHGRLEMRSTQARLSAEHDPSTRRERSSGSTTHK